MLYIFYSSGDKLCGYLIYDFKNVIFRFIFNKILCICGKICIVNFTMVYL